MKKTLEELDERIRLAVAEYWRTRASQRDKQEKSGRADKGSRAAVTGGAQMDAFVALLTELIVDAGAPEECVFRKKALEIPGFFRPTKKWDILVVKDGVLVAAIEAKSQVGPSFGNNFNNRTEEAIGSALDLWTAYREGAYLTSPQPFLGYLFVLEDCEKSRCPVGVKEPHFSVLREFVDTSYMKRYELLCRKLVLERHYTAAAFLASGRATGESGEYETPAQDLSFQRFAAALSAHVEGVT